MNMQSLPLSFSSKMAVFCLLIDQLLSGILLALRTPNVIILSLGVLVLGLDRLLILCFLLSSSLIRSACCLRLWFLVNYTQLMLILILIHKHYDIPIVIPVKLGRFTWETTVKLPKHADHCCSRLLSFIHFVDLKTVSIGQDVLGQISGFCNLYVVL